MRTIERVEKCGPGAGGNRFEIARGAVFETQGLEDCENVRRGDHYGLFEKL